MTVTVAKVATIAELAERLLDDYRDLCNRERVDPDVELLEVGMAGHGVTAAQWMRTRIARAKGGEPAPDPQLARPRPYTEERATLSYRGTASAYASFVLDDPTSVHWFLTQSGTAQEFRLACTLHPDPDIRLAAIEHLWTGEPEQLTHLCDDPEVKVRYAIARRWSNKPAIAARLARDPKVTVRTLVADAWWVPADVIEVLASDPEVAVRRRIVARRDVTRAVLDRLWDDPEVAVRAEYATSRRARVWHLDRLADDPDMHVRFQVARNKRTPDHALARLRRDPEHAVATIANNPDRGRTRKARRR